MYIHIKNITIDLVCQHPNDLKANFSDYLEGKINLGFNDLSMLLFARWLLTTRALIGPATAKPYKSLHGSKNAHMQGN